MKNKHIFIVICIGASILAGGCQLYNNKISKTDIYDKAIEESVIEEGIGYTLQQEREEEDSVEIVDDEGRVKDINGSKDSLLDTLDDGTELYIESMNEFEYCTAFRIRKNENEVTLSLEGIGDCGTYSYKFFLLSEDYIALSPLIVSGTGTHIWGLWIYDANTLESRSDIIEDPLIYIKDNIVFMENANTIYIDVNGKEYSLVLSEESMLDTEDISISYGGSIEYNWENNQLIASVGLYYGAYNYVGEILLVYTEIEGEFVVDDGSLQIISYE